MTYLRVCLFLALLVGSATAAREFSRQEMAVHREHIDAINADSRSTYVAGENEFFKGKTLEEAKSLMGTILEDHFKFSHPVKTFDHIKDSDIPTSFDSRTQWPNFIHPIRNQERCGSCWAFAASEALSDRFAIASNGTVNVVLSPEDLVSCDEHDMGCMGGILSQAWKYLTETGIVTDQCFPYTAGTGTAPPCPAAGTCAADGVTYQKYKSQDYYRLATVQDIQKAIMTNGPVEAGFEVYKSFMSYKSGVYSRQWWQFWDTLMGGHAIKIVGWGVQDGEDYWLIANSWGTTWGLDGFFKIKKGVNECEIESTVYAGHPLLS